MKTTFGESVAAAPEPHSMSPTATTTTMRITSPPMLVDRRSRFLLWTGMILRGAACAGRLPPTAPTPPTHCVAGHDRYTEPPSTTRRRLTAEVPANGS